jgi:radical S-adenosyl methionine domain-containing protein 2
VNFHVWQPCNMRCTYCFAKFRDVRAEVLPAGHLSRPDAIEVVRLLAEAGFQKITFAGGEPFLCPWLPELIDVARNGGLTTSVVTNGSLLTDELVGELAPVLDWLVLSIDSACPGTLRAAGRVTGRRVLGPDEYLSICHRVREAGIRLKINTVVSRLNWREDLGRLIVEARPLRWKIMQVLPISGQNSPEGEMEVAPAQFEEFVARHRHVERHGITVVSETNEQMIGSYAMVDPAGRFFDNTAGFYRYSDPILACGAGNAMAQVIIDREKFLARGGRYDWAADPSVRLVARGAAPPD